MADPIRTAAARRLLPCVCGGRAALRCEPSAAADLLVTFVRCATCRRTARRYRGRQPFWHAATRAWNLASLRRLGRWRGCLTLLRLMILPPARRRAGRRERRRR